MEPTESGGRACPPMCPRLGWHLTLEMNLKMAMPLTVRYAYQAHILCGCCLHALSAEAGKTCSECLRCAG